MKQHPVGKLRDKAVSAAGKGRHDKALGYYQKLEAMEPNDGAWARKSAEMYRALGDSALAIEAYARASLIYAEEGFLVKAVAVCKIILRMDPDNLGAQEQLVSFNTARGIHCVGSRPVPHVEGKTKAASIPPPLPAIPEDDGLQDIDLGTAPYRTPPPIPAHARAPAAPINTADTALEDIDLGEAKIESRERVIDGEPSGIIEILIDSDVMVLESSEDNAREALLHTPLFSALSGSSLSMLIEKVRLVNLRAGEVLFSQGDRGTTLYVVVEGRVAALDDGPPSVELAELGDGEFFGEIALVTNQPRVASVKAIVDTELLAIDRHTIGELIAKEPAVLGVLCRFLRKRLVESLVKTSALFQPFDRDERRRLVDRFQFLEVAGGTTLLEQGKKAPALYIVMSGELDVLRRGDSESAQHITTLHRGDVFGEMSLLTQAGASATVVTKAKCLVLELPATVFRQIIMTHPRILSFVGDLAAEREEKLAAIGLTEAPYEDLHLDLF